MIDASIKKHLDIIKNQMNLGKAALFIGAGMSLNAEPKFKNTVSSFKTWHGFIEQIAAQLWPELYKNDKVKFNDKLVQNNTLIAQLYEEEFGREAFYNELLKSIPYKDYKPSDVHNNILDLDWDQIVTTNQDNIIEQSLDEIHKNYDVIIDDIDIPVKNALLKLYKIHGSMEKPGSIVFTEEQYRTYEKESHRLF